MKGNMSREDFNEWVEFAATRRDTTILLMEGTANKAEKNQMIESLKEDLNRK